jgi:uncharacterized protein (TIGR00369 family)
MSETPEAAEALGEVLAELTGAQLMQAVAERRVPHLEHYDTLGLRVVRAVPDRVEMAWTPPGTLANFVGAVHGGHTAMVFDEVCCSAGVSNGERFVPMITLSLSVDYLRAVRPGLTYAVMGEVVHAGRSRLLVNATIRGPEGDLIAQAHAAVLPNAASTPKATAEREPGPSAGSRE